MRAEPSGRRLSEADASVVKGMLRRNDRHHDIAAWFGVNQGRIAEVKENIKFPDVLPAPASQLPPPGPYSSGRTAYKAVQALEEAKVTLEKALTDIDAALKNVRKSG